MESFAKMTLPLASYSRQDSDDQHGGGGQDGDQGCGPDSDGQRRRPGGLPRLWQDSDQQGNRKRQSDQTSVQRSADLTLISSFDQQVYHQCHRQRPRALHHCLIIFVIDIICGKCARGGDMTFQTLYTCQQLHFDSFYRVF